MLNVATIDNTRAISTALNMKPEDWDTM